MLDRWDSGGMESRDESRAERIQKAGDMKRREVGRGEREETGKGNGEGGKRGKEGEVGEQNEKLGKHAPRSAPSDTAGTPHMLPAAAAAAVHTALAGAPAHDEWQLDECESGGASASWSVSVNGRDWRPARWSRAGRQGRCCWVESQATEGQAYWAGGCAGTGCMLAGREKRRDAGVVHVGVQQPCEGSMLQKESQDNSSKRIEKSTETTSAILSPRGTSLGKLQQLSFAAALDECLYETDTRR
ncbi:hypothetical protein B0H13DRAFT_1903578 [Mycena leptocephala]|nr:hypothetical protein B0H13DRAFT_1903578 [Mycena leptocephala]